MPISPYCNIVHSLAVRNRSKRANRPVAFCRSKVSSNKHALMYQCLIGVFVCFVACRFAAMAYMLLYGDAGSLPNQVHILHRYFCSVSRNARLDKIGRFCDQFDTLMCEYRRRLTRLFARAPPPAQPQSGAQCVDRCCCLSCLFLFGLFGVNHVRLISVCSKCREQQQCRQ